MIKRNIKLLIVLLTVALVTSVSIFYACKKEEKIINNPIVENHEKNYEDHIKELITTTGIDIYELRKLDKIRKIADVPREIMSVATEASLTKGEFTEAKLEQMQNLLAAIYAASTDNAILALYESFCNICMTIDGFQMNNGIAIFNYDPANPFIGFEKEMLAASVLYEEIGNSYSSFPSLPQETQIEIIAAAIYLNLQNNNTKGPVEDCRNEALRMYAVTASLATADLTGSLVGCAFTGPGAGACCAIAGAKYGVTMGVGYWQYKRAIKKCG